MAKWLILWKMREAYYSMPGLERLKLGLSIHEMLRAEMDAGLYTDHGSKPNGGEGYAIFEGTETQLNESLSKYTPYIYFETTPVVSQTLVHESLKKRLAAVQK